MGTSHHLCHALQVCQGMGSSSWEKEALGVTPQVRATCGLPMPPHTPSPPFSHRDILPASSLRAFKSYPAAFPTHLDWVLQVCKVVGSSRHGRLASKAAPQVRAICSLPSSPLCPRPLHLWFRTNCQPGVCDNSLIHCNHLGCMLQVCQRMSSSYGREASSYVSCELCERNNQLGFRGIHSSLQALATVV